MIGNQPASKKERTDYHPSRDLLSGLCPDGLSPLSIVHKILALVPIRDAIRTSILSRQWRYAWTSLPYLVFNEMCPDGESVYEFEKRMENFITHVLLLHKGPIHTFNLSVPFERKCRNIGAWFRCLSKNDVRELILYSPYSYSWIQELRSCIYSCKKLIKLELHNCKLDPPPTTFKAFLFLKCLFLQKVYLTTKEVESLVANCPLLEEFTLIDWGSSKLRFSAPKLKVLQLEGDYIEMSVYAPLLAELKILLFSNQQQNRSVCNYTDFIGGFTNLEKLHAEGYFTKYLSMGIEYCHHTLVFHRLKDIKLNEVNFENVKHISLVARLIVGAPNLQKLEISNIYIACEDDADASDVPRVSFSDFGCALNFKLENLRVVKMRAMAGVIGLPQMAFIRFCLERSPVLETMSFGGLSPKEKQKLSAESELCSRAAPNAKLVLN